MGPGAWSAGLARDLFIRILPFSRGASDPAKASNRRVVHFVGLAQSWDEPVYPEPSGRPDRNNVIRDSTDSACAGALIHVRASGRGTGLSLEDWKRG
jgi:hypothetical protein